jgi:glycosyltransferase involved in cell wall biosynthesis
MTGVAPAKWTRDVADLFEQLTDLHCETVGGCVPTATEYPLRPDAAPVYLPRWHVLLYHSPVVESFGRVVVEAMAAGCVPLVDPRGGPAETVVDGVTGFHCHTPAEFVDRVRLLESDRVLWKRLSDAARLWARTMFSHEQFGRQLRESINHARHHRGLLSEP